MGEAIEIVEAAADIFVVRLIVQGAGASSGASIRLELSQLWRFDNDRPVSVREFTSFTEALSPARQ